jgi:hypothetical protein
VNRSLSLTAWCWLSFASCERARPFAQTSAAHVDAIALAAATADPSSVVATVDGRAITENAIATQAAAAHVSAKVALDQLLDSEALFAESARRGLDRAPAVKDAVAEAAVRTLLHKELDPRMQPALIPSRDVEKKFADDKLTYDHPAAVDVCHILVPTPKDDPAGTARAKSLAEELARRAKSVHSVDEFRALAATLPPDIKPVVEQLQTPRYHFTEEPFAAAAFTLTRPGQTTGPVQTSYGYHVIYLVAMQPAVHESFAAAETDIRRALLPSFANAEFLREVDDLVAQHRVELHAERLVENQQQEGN